MTQYLLLRNIMEEFLHMSDPRAGNTDFEHLRNRVDKWLTEFADEEHGKGYDQAMAEVKHGET